MGSGRPTIGKLRINEILEEQNAKVFSGTCLETFNLVFLGRCRQHIYKQGLWLNRGNKENI